MRPTADCHWNGSATKCRLQLNKSGTIYTMQLLAGAQRLPLKLLLSIAIICGDDRASVEPLMRSVNTCGSRLCTMILSSERSCALMFDISELVICRDVVGVALFWLETEWRGKNFITHKYKRTKRKTGLGNTNELVVQMWLSEFRFFFVDNTTTGTTQSE